MAMDKGYNSCLAFTHMLNLYVLTIFCIFGTFLIEWPNYAFFFLFRCINLRGIVLGLTQGVDKGKGMLTLCGSSGHMWTRMGKMMNGV